MPLPIESASSSDDLGANSRTSLPAQLMRDAVAALVVGLAAISSYVSAATLVFQGALLPYLPVSIGAALLGGALLALMAAWRGSLPLASAGPVPTTVPLLAAMAASVAAQASAEGLLPTAVVTLAIAAAGVGMAWYWMGRRAWGDLTRYLPYPVVGGFLAATAWMMLAGGLGVSMGQAFSWTQVAAWVMGGADARLLVGVLLGGLIWQLSQRNSHPLTLPALLVLGTAGIRAALAVLGWDAEASRAAGWLLSPFSHALPVWPLAPDLLAQVQWNLVAQQAGLWVSMLAVATLSLLLSDTSLELAWDSRADINRDLRAMGQGNLLAAMAGGMLGGVSVSRSLLNRAAGARSRYSGAFLGLLCLLAMVWGGPLLALMPRPLLGALLVSQGLAVMKTWVWDSRKRLKRMDYLTVLAMVLITASLGFLPAVCFGVLACCLDFAVGASRLAPIRRQLPRSAWPVKAERSAAQAALLQAEGARMLVVELQGVLFFGSAMRLSAQMEPLCEAATRPRLLLLDFRHVQALDVSAAQCLSRLLAQASRHGPEIALSGLSPGLRQPLLAGGVLLSSGPQVYDSIDAAVSAWDEAILTQRPEGRGASIEALLAQCLPQGTALAALLAHFEPCSLRDGERLFAQGDASDALYILRSGCILIHGVASDGQELLLRSMHAGSVIGEMGLLRHSPRSAFARAQGAVELLQLSRERLDLLSAQAPELAAALFRLLVMQMAGRVEQLSSQANALAH